VSALLGVSQLNRRVADRLEEVRERTLVAHAGDAFQRLLQVRKATDRLSQVNVVAPQVGMGKCDLLRRAESLGVGKGRTTSSAYSGGLPAA
jgi:hypothetical protein